MPRFRFAEFLYDSDEARLLRGDEQIVLQPRVHDALLFFLEQRGQLLTKEQLLDKYCGANDWHANQSPAAARCVRSGVGGGAQRGGGRALGEDG